MQVDEIDDSTQLVSAYIAYATKDKEKAEQIFESLEKKGLCCWMAQPNMRDDKGFADEIASQILNSKCMVLVMSAGANESDAVRCDVEYAVKNNKPVYPVRVEDVLPSRSLELFVSSTHWIDAWSGDLLTHIEHLASNILGESDRSNTVRTTYTPARRYKKIYWITGLTSAIVVLLAITLNSFTPTKPVLQPVPAPPQEDVFVTILDQFGGIENIKKDDIELVIETAVNKGHATALKFKGGNNLDEVLRHTPIEYQDLNGEWVKTGSGGAIYLDQSNEEIMAMIERGKFTVRFDTSYIAISTGRSGYIGPFTYELTYTEDVLKSYKKRALRERNWLEKGQDGEMALTVLRDIFPAVKEIRFGKSTNALNEVISVTDLPPLYNIRAIEDTTMKYFKLRLPDNLNKADRVYIQITFYDGSQSEIREFERAKVF